MLDDTFVNLQDSISSSLCVIVHAVYLSKLLMTCQNKVQLLIYNDGNLSHISAQQDYGVSEKQCRM